MERGKQPVIIHLGDHDPSGIDMTRDNQVRSTLFACSDVSVQRIALNMDQVKRYDPPPFFAKITDARADTYVSRFGDNAWELDALEPRVLAGLVEGALEDCITDRTAWEEVADREKAAKTHLQQLYGRWDDIIDMLEGGNG